MFKETDIFELCRIEDKKERLKKARKIARYTQEALASELHLSRSTIVAFEDNKNNRFYDNEELYLLSDLYGCSLDVLKSGVYSKYVPFHNVTGLSQSAIEWLESTTDNKKKILNYIFSNKDEADYLTDIILCFVEAKIPKVFLKNDEGDPSYRPSLYLGDEEKLLDTVLASHLTEMLYSLRDKNIIGNQREIDVNDPQYIELMDSIHRRFEERRTQREKLKEEKMEEYLRDVTEN